MEREEYALLYYTYSPAHKKASKHIKNFTYRRFFKLSRDYLSQPKSGL